MGSVPLQHEEHLNVQYAVPQACLWHHVPHNHAGLDVACGTNRNQHENKKLLLSVNRYDSIHIVSQLVDQEDAIFI